ncbi:MAG TPA: hypothetical protein VNS52_18095 [Gemmatimonadaceae bacterium]|nr:hypothetical protein [Gemmatimonadaceae bacterium]
MRNTRLLALGTIALTALAACSDSTGPKGIGSAPRAALAAGGYHNCRITGTKTECWGYNGDGQLGDGTYNQATTPVTVSGGLTFVHVTTGYYHTCALTSAGKAYCWGYNGYSQLGDGTTNDSNVPVAVGGGLTFTSLTTGDSHNCGLTSSGTAYCWGGNWSGQLGDNTNTDQSSPVPVSTTLKFAKITAIGSHTCALTTDGTAYCWGDNWRGKLGDGTNTETEHDTPTAVVGGHAFTQIVGGYDHSCGLAKDGKTYCWGYNGEGELGIGTADDNVHGTPAAVVGGQTFKVLSEGRFDQLCGLTSAGQAYCWGYNAYGQIGDGTTDNRATPVAIGGAIRFSAIAAGDSHTCGRATTGATYCWGSNGDGQIGDGTYVEQHSPVAVSAGAAALRASASIVSGGTTSSRGTPGNAAHHVR